MARGGADKSALPDLQGLVSVRGEARSIPVISVETRKVSDRLGWDWDEKTIYASGGRMKRQPTHFLAGCIYVTVSHEDGRYVVKRQQQQVRSRGWRFGDTVLETLYEGDNINRAASVANAAWSELRADGVEWLPPAKSEEPDVELLKEGQFKQSVEESLPRRQHLA